MLSFREEINQEIVRVVMLPERDLNVKVPSSDCAYCQGLEDIAWRIQNLLGRHWKCIHGFFSSMYFITSYLKWNEIFLYICTIGNCILYGHILLISLLLYNLFIVSVCAQREDDFTEQSKCLNIIFFLFWLRVTY